MELQEYLALALFLPRDASDSLGNWTTFAFHCDSHDKIEVKYDLSLYSYDRFRTIHEEASAAATSYISIRIKSAKVPALGAAYVRCNQRVHVECSVKCALRIPSLFWTPCFQMYLWLRMCHIYESASTKDKVVIDAGKLWEICNVARAVNVSANDMYICESDTGAKMVLVFRAIEQNGDCIIDYYSLASNGAVVSGDTLYAIADESMDGCRARYRNAIVTVK